MKRPGKRFAALLLALVLLLTQSASALAMAAGTWPEGYEAAGCPSEDAQIRNEGKHWYSCSEYQEPWCETSGYAVFTCVYCGDTQTRYIAPEGHIWGDWSEQTPSSCGVEGTEVRYCQRCQQPQTRSTAALEHDWSEWDENEEPTCTEPGNMIRFCNNCWQVEYREIPALGHAWAGWDIIEEPTCTSPGLRYHYCTRCQLEETEEISPLGHAWGSWHVEYPGTCVERGMNVRTCTRCRLDEYRYSDYGDHDWGEWQVVVAPTATEPGVEERVCNYSEDHVEEREIPPTGESPDTDPEPDIEPEPIPGVIPDPVPGVSVPPDGGEAALQVVYKDTSNPLKAVYDLQDMVSYSETITNVGTVDVELLDWSCEWSDGSTLSGSSGERTLLKPGESTSKLGKISLAGYFTLTSNKLVPGTETEDLAGIAWVQHSYPGYRPGTDEVLCVGTGSLDYLVAKSVEGEEPPHEMTVTISWDEGIGEGKRYEGAEIPLYFTCTNTGETPVRAWLYDSGKTELQPGESINYALDRYVTSLEAEEGVLHVSACNTWSWHYDYQNAEGDWEDEWTESNSVIIPLTYPEGMEPEPDRPELTLTYLRDDPEKDVYDPDDAVWADYSLANTGNVPLYVVAHFTSEGVRDYDSDDGFFDPGDTEEAGWGWYTIKNGITPGTETEDLLGTVTISYYYKGLDVETKEELCRTQAITRTWKVGKPDEGPTPWPIPEESDITAEIVEYTASADPAGYQLGEYWSTTLIRTNTGTVDIPSFSVYDPYDGWTKTWGDFAVGDTISYPGEWTCGWVTEGDVERGYIYLPPVQITWEDPDSGNERIAYSNDLYLPVISKTGLLLEKGIAQPPANGEYFEAGETIVWRVKVTNTSKEPVTNVTVTDQGLTLGEIERIEPGETFVFDYTYTVTEYDALVGFVSNEAVAKGTDLLKVERTYVSNIVTVPANAFSPIPVPVPVPVPGTDIEPPPKEPDPEIIPPPEVPDPKGPIYGYDVNLIVFKTLDSSPKNGEYYELDETVDFIITLTNTGMTDLENISVTDSLAGFTPIGTAVSLASGESVSFPYSYTVTQADIDAGFVVNSAIVSYSFGGGIPGTPVQSNEVKVDAGKGTPTDGNIDELIPPVTFKKGDGLESCLLTLTAVGDSGTNCTLHACAAHTEAALNAEAAAQAGDYAAACDIWSAEIEALYETLYEKGNSEGKAAVVNDRAAFNAYVDAFRALLGDEAAAELLRLRTAELCCMIRTAPEQLPDSLLGSYSNLMAEYSEKCQREFSALNGSDAEITERYDAAHGEVLQEAVRVAQSARYGTAQENAFKQILRRWQMALDSVVNAQYKAADKETRKQIAALRMALDTVYEARRGLLTLLYEEAPEAAAEALSSLYRNALIDFCGR